MSLNYSQYIQKSKAILTNWSRRNLSLIAKVNVINTLIASQFVYKMLVLPELSPTFIKQMEDIFSKFIWANRKAKISMKILKANKDSGGLGLVDLHQKDLALKAAWPVIMQQDNKHQALVYEIIAPELKENLWRCSLMKKDVHVLGLPSFWNSVLFAWTKYNYDPNLAPNMQIIWWNSSIRVKGVPFLWTKPLKKGLLRVSQLFDSGNLIPFEIMHERFGLNFMQYGGLISSLPKEWKKACSEDNSQLNVDAYNYDIICTQEKLASKLYAEFTSSPELLQEKVQKWKKELQTTIEYSQFLQCIADICRVTNITKYRSFQYRLLNRGIVTNIHLKHWNILSSHHCSFCNRSRETYIHLFIECEKVQPLWIKLEAWLEHNFNAGSIEFGLDTVIANKIMGNPSHLYNFVCLLMKQFIYKHRCLKMTPTFVPFI